MLNLLAYYLSSFLSTEVELKFYPSRLTLPQISQLMENLYIPLLELVDTKNVHR
jgi:hypothetical protein